MKKLQILLLSSLILATGPIAAQQPAAAPAAPAPAAPAAPANSLTPPPPANSVTPNTQLTQPRANALNPTLRSDTTTPSTDTLNRTPRANTSTSITADPATTTAVSIPRASTLVLSNPDGSPVNPNTRQNVAGFQTAPGLGGLTALDGNGDSMLTRQEFLSYYERQYDAMKKNTVGVVDLRRMQETNEELAERE